MSNTYCRISFTSTSNPKGLCFGRRSNYCLTADTVSHKSSSGAWQSGELMKVLCQVQSFGLLVWAWSFTHLWPINTAWVNITVCCYNLCLTLVNWRKNSRDMEYVFLTRLVFFPKTENTVHQLPLQSRFWRMWSKAWGYLCGILLMESIFGCDLIFTTFPLWESALPRVE